mmetsp:Transcript_35710/g.77943  ORF Transcript_35710/g.77943 Transcript_35710/m.77943 type:complete len:237 (-) Transcript_35710:566-1276(-)
MVLRVTSLRTPAVVARRLSRGLVVDVHKALDGVARHLPRGLLHCVPRACARREGHHRVGHKLRLERHLHVLPAVPPRAGLGHLPGEAPHHARPRLGHLGVGGPGEVVERGDHLPGGVRVREDRVARHVARQVHLVRVGGLRRGPRRPPRPGAPGGGEPAVLEARAGGAVEPAHPEHAHLRRGEGGGERVPELPVDAGGHGFLEADARRLLAIQRHREAVAVELGETACAIARRELR